MNQLLLAYVPVLHAGYMRLFQSYRFSDLGLLTPETYNGDPTYEKLSREIRALDAHLLKRMIESVGIFSSVELYGIAKLCSIQPQTAIVMPDEDVSRAVAEVYLTYANITYEPVFLRFDLPKTLSKTPPASDRQISSSLFDREMMGLAFLEAARSPDWWRQVGAVAVRDGEILYTAHNSHMPSEHSLYALGDPRNNFKAGEQTELSCAHHAERSIIAAAARDGIPLRGATLYVTTFPCAQCAYSIVRAGFKRVFYKGGYSQLQAAETCKAYDVELIHVTE